MVLSLELNGAPFSVEGFKSTKQRRTQQLREEADSEKSESLPERYTSNSNKEELCLEYIANFRSQFEKLYPGRRRLFLTAPNEYGVEKFVCTTLRPTLLPYCEVYDLHQCAEFVSNFLHYEPLERPTQPPSCLPSPGQVLDWTVGDPFDFAMVLCSFLLGAGYDAYVVYGTAPKWITVRDRSRTPCPFIASTMPPKTGEEDHENGIGIPRPPVAGTMVDDREALGRAGSSKIGPHGAHGQSEETNGIEGGVNDAQADKPGQEGSTADLTSNVAAGEGTEAVLPEGSADAPADGRGPGSRDEGRSSGGEDEAAEGIVGGGEYSLDPGSDEEDKGFDEEKAEEKYTQPYKVQPRGAPTSMFLAEVARRKEEERKAAMLDPWQSDGEEEEIAEASLKEEEDSLRGERMHAWVLVRGGKRGVGYMSYVEPTTGAVWATSEGPYLSVEALFNDKNYWVNMQQQQQQQYQPRQEGNEHKKVDPGQHPAAGDVKTSSLSFDLLDGNLWAYVFIDPMQEAMESGGAAGENDDLGLLSEAEDGVEATAKGGEGGSTREEHKKESILDLPPSWVSRLSLDRDLTALRYPPRGRRTVMYHRTKAELFAENVHDEGMTLRLTLYKDRNCTIAKEIREVFVNRADRLYSRVHYPLEGKVSELFRPGRPNALRNMVTWSGRRREFYFFVEARLDGLVARFEDIGEKIIQTMQGRSDRLTYRSVNVTSPDEVAAKGVPGMYVLPATDGASDMVVYKMTEKFARNRGVPAERDIAKRTYYLAEGRIRTLYHYPEGDVTRISKMYFKDNRVIASGGGAAFAHDSGVKKGWRGEGASNVGRSGVAAAASAEGGIRRGSSVGSGGGAPSASGGKTEETLQDAIMAEKISWPIDCNCVAAQDCFTAARHAHLETAELIKLRHHQEEEVAIERLVFDTARERRAEQEKMAKEMEEEKDKANQRQVDYLTPFLQHVADVHNISAADAQRARDACLRALKDRLLERANIINSRLNDETSALAKKRAAFQRNQRDTDACAEEEFDIFCSAAMFRIKVLEQRLVLHEENALKKYADLDAKLASDTRLKALNA